MKIEVFFSLLTLFVIFSYQADAQSHDSRPYKLHVYLENAPFDSLFLRDYTNGRDVLFAGEKTQEFTWEISIPDSIASTSENMELIVTLYDSIENSSRTVRLMTHVREKKVFLANVGIENENNYIHGKYIGESEFPHERLLNHQGVKVVGNLYSEDFELILLDEKSDLSVRAENPNFSWFINFDGEETSYDDYLASYVNLSKKHPDSRYLMTSLSNNLKLYKSKKDVRAIYENLSDKHKKTHWATNIDRFLLGKFENTPLPTLLNNIEEDIVQDSSKYNLVIFSASWCAPCIEEIPLLKKIYKDLSDDLILTFVSLDEENTVASFQKLIQEQNIPWRTLYAYQDVRAIKQKYVAETIPHTILVHPNGEMEIIDVRKEENQTKLYSLF